MSVAHPVWTTVRKKVWIAVRFVLFGVTGVWLTLFSSVVFLSWIFSSAEKSHQNMMSPFLSLPLTLLGVAMALFGAGVMDKRERVAPVPAPANPRLRGVVTLASLVSAGCIMAAASIRLSQSVEWFEGLAILFVFWLPYVFIPFRLRGEKVKSGLSLAIAMGCALFVPGVALIYHVHQWAESWWIQGTVLLALLIQPILVAAAVRAYKSLPRERHDTRNLVVSGSYGVLLFAMFWFTALFGNFPSPIGYNEAEAMESMRSAYMSADVYARDHEGAFPDAAATWGPDAKEECRAYYEPRLASRQPEYGYVFDYHGEPSDKLVHGCRVAQSYTVTARPSVFGKSGRRSFFVDQTHVIRFTLENRPANVNDPPIPPGSLPPL